MMKFDCDFEIIDAHVHPFQDPARSLAHFGRFSGTEEFVAELRKVGINRACGSVIGMREDADFAGIRARNDIALALHRAYPDFLIPGIHIHGGYVEESVAELHRMHAQGVRWIGELVPYILGTQNLDSPGNMAILETARDLGMTVNLHGGAPDEVGKVAKAFPTLNIVLAHPGDTADFQAKAKWMAPLKNVHLDYSGTGLFRWGSLAFGIRELGAERVLFGTDFPICNPGLYLYGALCENLSRREFELFFSGNFRRLTSL